MNVNQELKIKVRAAKLKLLILTATILAWSTPSFGGLTYGQANALKALDRRDPANLTRIIAAVESAAAKDVAGIKVLAKHHGLETTTASKELLLAKLRADLAELSAGAGGGGGGGSGSGSEAEADADEKYAPGARPERESKDEPSGAGFGGGGGGGSATAAPVEHNLATIHKKTDIRPTFVLIADPELADIARSPVYPKIGHYGASYNLRASLANINLPATKLADPALTPEAVRTAVSGISPRNLQFSINVFGQFYPPLAGNVSNNVIFHFILMDWPIKKTKHGIDFNENILGGLFAPNGVTTKAVPNSIPENQLKAININYHDDGHISPNNACFKLVDGRQIASFWLVGKHIGHAVVSLNLIINDTSSGFGARLSKAIADANNLEGLVLALSEAVSPLGASAPTGKSAEDIATAAEFNSTLTRLF